MLNAYEVGKVRTDSPFCDILIGGQSQSFSRLRGLIYIKQRCYICLEMSSCCPLIKLVGWGNIDEVGYFVTTLEFKGMLIEVMYM